MTAEAPIDRTLLKRRVKFLRSVLANRDEPVPVKDASISWDRYLAILEDACERGQR